MNNDKQLLIKARLSKTEIRRFSVAVPKTFDEFSGSIAAALELDAARLANLRFSWEDEEGDQIALVNNADLSEALRAVATSDDKLMRLSVRPTREEERKLRHEQREQREQRHAHHGHGRPRHCGGAGHFMGPLAALMQQLQVGLPELLSNPAIRTMAEGLISSNANLVKIDTGRICDNCQGAIVGDRYASTTQDDFDLCSMCMVSDAGAKLQQVHQFRKIAAFEALMQCLANGGGVDAFFATEQGEQQQAEQPKCQPHHHATCDVCNNTIVGSRFKSLVLDNYDECSACRAKSDKPASDFYEITDVTQRNVPEHVVTAHKLQKEAEKAAADAAVEATKAAKKAQEAQEAARVASSRLVAPKVVAVEQPKVIAEAPKKEVEAPKPSAPVAAAAASPSAAVPSAFEQNLQTLESMGFTSRKANISALVRNRNQLFAAIQSLIE